MRPFKSGYRRTASVEAQAYLVTTESMRKHFGDRFHVNLIHELWLRKRIEQFLKKRTRPGESAAPDADHRASGPIERILGHDRA